MEQQNIKIQIQEDCLEISHDIVKQIKVVKKMVDDFASETLSEEPIPIPSEELTLSDFKKIVEFCDQHKDLDPEIFAKDDDNDNYDIDDDDGKFEIKLSEWDNNFFGGLEKHELFRIMNASNYLEIKVLLEFGCKYVAEHIKGKSVEELREYFEQENDFTPEEEEELRKQHAWIEDE